MADETIAFDFMVPITMRVNVATGEIEYALLSCDDIGRPEIFTAGVEIDGQETPEYLKPDVEEHKELYEKLSAFVEDISIASGQTGEIFLPFQKTDERGRAVSEPTFGVAGEEGAQDAIRAQERVHRRYDDVMRARYAEERRQEAEQEDIRLTSLAETPIEVGPPARRPGLSEDGPALDR